MKFLRPKLSKLELPAAIEFRDELPKTNVGKILRRALRDETLMVSVMHANNETGVVFPVARLARLAKETDPSIVVHTDATQTMGKLPIDLDIVVNNAGISLVNSMFQDEAEREDKPLRRKGDDRLRLFGPKLGVGKGSSALPTVAWSDRALPVGVD